MTSIVYKKTGTSEELYLTLRIEVSWEHNLTGAAWKERDLTLKPTTLSPCPGVAQASKHILFIYRISTQAEFFLLYDFSSPNKGYRCSYFLSVAVMDTAVKATQGREVSPYSCRSHSISEGSQRTSPDFSRRDRNHEGTPLAGFLAGFFSDSCLAAFLLHPKTTA